MSSWIKWAGHKNGRVDKESVRESHEEAGE